MNGLPLSSLISNEYSSAAIAYHIISDIKRKLFGCHHLSYRLWYQTKIVRLPIIIVSDIKRNIIVRLPSPIISSLISNDGSSAANAYHINCTQFCSAAEIFWTPRDLARFLKRSGLLLKSLKSGSSSLDFLQDLDGRGLMQKLFGFLEISLDSSVASESSFGVP